jgi:putative sterol carrier protein
MTLDELTSAIRSKAALTPRLGYRVKFDIVGEGAILWDGTGDQPDITNEDGSADTTISISGDDLSKLMRGELNPTLAYMTGRLKVDGSLGVAMKINQMLED